MVFLILEVPEKSLLAVRIAAFALARQHEAHIVAEAFNRRALVGGNRTIIAQYWCSLASYNSQFTISESRWCWRGLRICYEAGQSSPADLYMLEPPKYFHAPNYLSIWHSIQYSSGIWYFSPDSHVEI